MSLRRSLSVVLGVLATTAPAWAQTEPVPEQVAQKKACIAAHAETQRQMQQERLVLAREAALGCAVEACPEPLRSECGRWLTELGASIAKVRLEVATSAGVAVTDADVLVDGRRVATKIADQPLLLDPGEHELTVIAGAARATERVALAKGEAPRVVRLQLVEPQPVVAAPLAEPPVPVVVPEPKRQSAGQAPSADRAPSAPRDRTAVYALLATGGVAALTGGYFAWSGLKEQRELESSCAPFCTSDEMSSMRSRYLAADIAFGVSVLAVGGALWLLLTEEPGAPAAQPVGSVRVTPHGAMLELGGSLGL